MSEYKNYTGWSTTTFYYSFVAVSVDYDKTTIMLILPRVYHSLI